jgi:mannose-1-phosphate guanylyltransferase
MKSWKTPASPQAQAGRLGNAAPKDAIFVNAHGNLVKDETTSSGNRVVALVGVDNLAVVMIDDAVLIIPRERAQDLRGVIEELKKRKQTERL